MKTVCVYHSIDLDGWMSAAIVKHWFNQQEVPNKKEEPINTIEFIGYNYGQPVSDLSEYDKVIMVDISFPKEEMINLGNRLQMNFIWIDHHISAIIPIQEEINNNPNFIISGIRDTKFAACELTWINFFNNESMPEIVRLLGRYDCFGHKGTDEERKVLEFQYGARAFITNYEEAYEYLLKDLKNNLTVNDIHQTGKIIYANLCTEAKQAYKNGFAIEFKLKYEYYNNIPNSLGAVEVKRFICINKERFNPINFGIDYNLEGYDGAACFHYDGIAKLWRFSLYNDNGKVDCSLIAKQFGGGGHKGAAGFVLDNEQFNNLIK